MSCNGPTRAIPRLSMAQFQSLSGFLMSCNGLIAPVSLGLVRFQSLSGFLMSCNASHTVANDANVTMFQSLSGFLMSCNDRRFRTEEAAFVVSIPIGFSNEL